MTFTSHASNLVADDTNFNNDVFVTDLQTGDVALASANATGTQGSADVSAASISADGRYVTFSNFDSNLVDGDSNFAYDIFREGSADWDRHPRLDRCCRRAGEQFEL